MAGFIPELIERAGSHGKTVVLAMDQSKISEGFECLMISLRVAERAIPVVKSRGFGIRPSAKRDSLLERNRSF